MSEIQYLLDENLGLRLRKALRQSAPQITVWCVSLSAPILVNTLGAKVISDQ